MAASSWDDVSQTTMVHEFEHIKQAEEAGGTRGFLRNYCSQYYWRGSYCAVDYEADARDAAADFRERKGWEPSPTSCDD